MADEEKVIKKPRGRKKTETTKSDITLEGLQTQMAQLMQQSYLIQYQFLIIINTTYFIKFFYNYLLFLLI